jgi:hypothetical protein
MRFFVAIAFLHFGFRHLWREVAVCDPCRKNLGELAGQTTNGRHKSKHGVWQVAGEADESLESANNNPSSSIGNALREHTATELAQQEPKGQPPDDTAEKVKRVVT